MAAQLLRASVQIDESHLHHFIRAAVDQIAEQLKRDMHVVHRGIGSLNERCDAMAETLTELVERTVPGLVNDLAAVQEGGGGGSSARARSSGRFKNILNQSNLSQNATTGGGRSLMFSRNAASSYSPGSASGTISLGGVANRTPSPSLDGPLSGRKDGGAGDGMESPPLDEDEVAFLQLSEQVTSLKERVTKCEGTLADDALGTKTLQSSLEAQQVSVEKGFNNLFDFLGLENNAVYGGIIRSQVLNTNPYLSEVSTLLDENSKRTTVVEANIKSKIDQAELEEIHFAVSDVRGVADAAVITFTQKESAMKLAVENLASQMREENRSKVGWTDLDKWQAALDETTSHTRRASIEAVSGLERLEKELTIFKQAFLPMSNSVNINNGGSGGGGPGLGSSGIKLERQFGSSSHLLGNRSSTASATKGGEPSLVVVDTGASPATTGLDIASHQNDTPTPTENMPNATPSPSGTAVNTDSGMRRRLSGAANYANYAQLKTANDMLGSATSPSGVSSVVSNKARGMSQRPQSAATVRRPLDFR